MKKFFINLLCCFIPNKQLRKKIRNNSKINSFEHINKRLDFFEDFIIKKFSNDSYIYEKEINGKIFYFSDGIISKTVDYVSYELNNDNEYSFNKINFQKGDIIIDIGGNIGMVSIYLAKKFPFLKIYAFEPVKENYDNFLKNMKLNNISKKTIILENKAVTCDGRTISMNICPTNKGESSINNKVDNEYTNIESITLNKIFEKYKIKKLKMLKIDCEGSEYEILYNTNKKYLKNIEIIRGEFHGKIKEINKLEEFCKENITKNILVEYRKVK